jgi:hypothetical protein
VTATDLLAASLLSGARGRVPPTLNCPRPPL